jgi:hypothetical protein
VLAARRASTATGLPLTAATTGPAWNGSACAAPSTRFWPRSTQELADQRRGRRARAHWPRAAGGDDASGGLEAAMPAWWQRCAYTKATYVALRRADLDAQAAAVTDWEIAR